MNTRRFRFNQGQEGEEGRTAPLQAVALGYDPAHDDAPRVLASGQGAVAQKILELAQVNAIPIREDPVLTAALAMLDIEETIPPELYALVAEVLAFVYRLKHEA